MRNGRAGAVWRGKKSPVATCTLFGFSVALRNVKNSTKSTSVASINSEVTSASAFASAVQPIIKVQCSCLLCLFFLGAEKNAETLRQERGTA